MKPSRFLALLAATLASTCGLATAQPRSLTIDAGAAAAQFVPAREREVEQTVQAWKLAWELGDAGTYVRFYHPAFRGDVASRSRWEQQRRTRLAQARISLDLQDLRVRMLASDEAEVRFVQRFSSSAHADIGEKRIVLRRHAGAWLITQERWIRRA